MNKIMNETSELISLVCIIKLQPEFYKKKEEI